MTLERATKLTGIFMACFAIFGSGAGAAVSIGHTGQRLTDLEQKVQTYGSDHDTLIRLDANIAWIMRALGGTPK